MVLVNIRKWLESNMTKSCELIKKQKNNRLCVMYFTELLMFQAKSLQDEKKKKQEEQDLLAYKSVMKQEYMHSNTTVSKSAKEYEEDFM